MQLLLGVLRYNGSQKSKGIGPNIRMRKLTMSHGRQTQGKTFPYLFSQCQPIYARSLLPIQGANLTLSYTAEQTLNLVGTRQSLGQNCEESLVAPARIQRH